MIFTIHFEQPFLFATSRRDHIIIPFHTIPKRLPFVKHVAIRAGQTRPSPAPLSLIGSAPPKIAAAGMPFLATNGNWWRVDARTQRSDGN